MAYTLKHSCVGSNVGSLIATAVILFATRVDATDSQKKTVYKTIEASNRTY